MLKELLDDVVAKDVCHKLKRVAVKLLEDLILFVAVSCFKLLLNEARAVLITAKFDNVIVDVLFNFNMGSPKT